MNPILPPERRNFYESYFIARQPIFSPKGGCWGYELLFRSSTNRNRAQFTDGSQASAQVIADGLALTLPDIQQPCKALVNMPEEMLRNRLSIALPKEKCVIEVLETVPPLPEIMSELRYLKALGYHIALDDFTGQDELTPFLALSDIVKVDFIGIKTGEQHEKIVRTLRKLETIPQILAEKVETREEFAFAKRCGYDLFQGFFFQKPELVSGRKVDLHSESKLQLLNTLASSEVTNRSLEKLIVRDTALSYRFMRFVNSSMWPHSAPVQTVSAAIRYIGLNPLRKWLMTTILADNNPNPMKQELALLGATRGYFFQWIASRMYPQGVDSAFMLGLFSTLEALYDLPFEALLSHISLPDDVTEALCMSSGRLGTCIPIAISLENGDLLEADRLLASIGIDDIKKASAKYQEAILIAGY